MKSCQIRGTSNQFGRIASNTFSVAFIVNLDTDLSAVFMESYVYPAKFFTVIWYNCLSPFLLMKCFENFWHC